MTHTTETKTDNKPRVFIGCPFNPTRGQWVDAVDILDAADHLRDQGFEELVAVDWEYLPGINENTPFSFIQEYAEMIEKHGPAFGSWWDNHGGDLDVEGFHESYQGQFDEYRHKTPLHGAAEQMAEDLGWYDALEEAGINTGYLDIDAIARDLDCSGWWFDADGHVFRPI